jgi:hypothetical protein
MKAGKWSPAKVAGRRSSSRARRRRRLTHAKRRATTGALGQQDKALAALGAPDDDQAPAVLVRGGLALLARGGGVGIEHPAALQRRVCC